MNIPEQTADSWAQREQLRIEALFQDVKEYLESLASEFESLDFNN